MNTKGAQLRLRDVLRADLARMYAANNGVEGSRSRGAAFIYKMAAKLEKLGNYRTRVVFCPPLPLLWAFRPGDGTPASVIHKAYLREVWRERRLPARIKLLLAIVFVWPLVNLVSMIWFSWLNGRTVQLQTGKGIPQQMLEQIRFSAHDAILPPWYYMFRLYEDRRRANAPAYLHRFETKQGVYRILKQSYRDDKQMKGLLTNKVQFAAHCVRNDLAAVATLAFVEDGRLTWNVPDERLPSIDLFLKPNFGRGGQGAERWDYVEPGSFRNNRTGEVRSHGELIAYLQDLSNEQSYIVQPRVRNHPNLIDLSNGVLLTCRLVTLRNEQGGHEMTDGVLRMAIGNNTLVDNLHAGGISAPIDRATGVLGRATDVGAKVGRGWIDRHPDTGAQISGRLVPLWRETMNLVERAHATLGNRVLIGWDVGILAEGPQIVEANASADLDIIQIIEDRPLGNERLGQLLAFHVERYFKDHENAHSVA